jgi:hypothetical protein
VTLRLPNLREALVLLVIGVALAATGIVWARVVNTISTSRPVTSSLKATSVVWGDLVFQSRADLTHWLHAHGATYIRWGINHPAARDLLEHRAPAKQAVRQTRTPTATVTRSRPHPTTAASAGSSSGATSTVTRSRPHPTTAASAGSSSGFPFERTLVTLLALLAAACALAASFPAALQYRYPVLARRIAPHRDVFLTGAAALVICIVAGVVLN